ncbi:HAMP domain-containing protein [Deinococcus budaensis]|uniref:HAMP domain-containing protein n=1 Tax=Deinococcus budaensis TaxID=1665626 RepID=A0A7W8GDE3_9DEIO|nr:HAMP domain-containing protein [Deinococcus budaensis]MBB5233486.1 HAMP domain-containing protein [Deinococcus budaensis]
MKYTVVIRQPVPDELRPRLEEQLVERFGLSPEQAQRLASRRAGRLMKPTGRARADLLLRVFESVGAQAALEEVRDETSLMTTPFEGTPPPAPFQVAPSAAAPDLTDDALLAPDPRPSPGEGADFAAPFAAQAADPFGPPALGGDPFAAPVAVGAVAAAPVPVAVGMGSSVLGTAPGTVTSAAPAARPAAGAASGSPASDDIWSDFTGALTVGEAAAPPVAAPGGDAEAFLAVADTERGTAGGRRRSLARQMLLASVAPLGVATTLALVTLSVLLPSAQQQVIQQNAQALAVAVGTSLDTRDQETVNAQLNALLTRSDVGFVRVELPDGTTYFRSQRPQLDGTLQGRVATFVGENPDSGTFVSSGSPADAYREQLEQLEAVGAGQSAQARELRTQIENPENQTSARASYIVSRLAVVETEDGQRTTAAASENGSDLLYRIAVGVDSTGASTRLRNTLLLVLGISLLAAAAAAALTLRTTRRIVQPIENLVKAAEAISMGDLSRPVQVGRNDEIGDLAQALERMRLSLESAMERLRRRKRG